MSTETEAYRQALCVCRKLHVVGRPKAAVGHLHHPRLRIGRGGARFARTRLLAGALFVLLTLCRILPRLLCRSFRRAACLFLLLCIQVFGHRQCGANPLLAILGRPLAGRGLPATGGSRIDVHLRAQISQRFFRSASAFLQGRMPAKRRRFVYLAAVVDWFSRRVLSWRLSITMDVDFCLEAVEDALARHGRPEIFNTDQGSQFTSAAFIGLLQANAIAVSMDGRGVA